MREGDEKDRGGAVDPHVVQRPLERLRIFLQRINPIVYVVGAWKIYRSFTIEKLVSILNVIGAVILPIYGGSMLLAPIVYCGGKWFQGGVESWGCIQSVWDRWQTLNAGVLALVASVVAFNISRVIDDNQRRRRFNAAKALATHALSQLTLYNQNCVKVLVEGIRSNELNPVLRSSLGNRHEELPVNSLRALAECIAESDGEISRYISIIVAKLQIHSSRLQSIEDYFDGKDAPIVMKINLISEIAVIAALQARINRLFDFSRGIADISFESFSLDEYVSVLYSYRLSGQLGVEVWAYLKRMIENGLNGVDNF